MDLEGLERLFNDLLVDDGEEVLSDDEAHIRGLRRAIDLVCISITNPSESVAPQTMVSPLQILGFWLGRTNVNAAEALSYVVEKRSCAYRFNIIRMLVDAGADVNQKNESGMTPILHALASSLVDPSYEEIALFLLKNEKVDICSHLKKIEGDMQILHLAAVSRDAEILSHVLRLYVHHRPGLLSLQVEARDLEGWTPLHLAVSRGYRFNAKLLLQAGADLEAKDHLGRNPLQLAKVLNDTTMVNLLLVQAESMKRTATRRPFRIWSGMRGFFGNRARIAPV